VLTDSSERTVKDIRLYIKEHPEYATPSTGSKGYTDLREAFWLHGVPYTDKVDMEISFLMICLLKVNNSMYV
jgi:hypothetical protein